MPPTYIHDYMNVPVRVCARFTDTGPVLRLEGPGQHLTKAQRYGHPTGRPFVESLIPPELMQALVLSFLEFGMRVGDARGRELLQAGISLVYN